MPALTLLQIQNRKPPQSRLTVIEFSQPRLTTKGKKESTIKCVCSCGVVKIILLRGFLYDTFSCGCLHKEKVSKLHKYRKVSKYSRKLRMCYFNMINRCTNPKLKSYKNYGGRGVKVCNEWVGSIDLFCEWAMQNGWNEKLEIDKDIKGDGLLYSPDTCCFVTSKYNQNNKRNIKKYVYNGEIKTLPEIADIVNKSRRLLYGRLRSGQTLDKATSTPLRIIKNKNHVKIKSLRSN